MQFTTNLATRSYINLRQLHLIIAITAILLILWLVFNIREIFFNLGETKRLETQIISLDRKIKGDSKGVPAKEYETVLAKIRFANSIIEKKSLNWLNFLEQLESVVPEGVTLSTVEPDVEKRTLKLTGYGKSFTDLRRFFEVLSSSAYFKNVFLENQSAIKVGQNQKGVSFTITCTVIYK
ncbi:PilN domain-containing protein [Geotalea toluenoxydans]|uniref:PilN domain-containing protein n=1 Tax=Geotalea toluenoxydans TaxID=421624 RepID=UPI0006D19F15|nr:PilN domain-containing protein [Geotalea toluenoxydans]